MTFSTFVDLLAQHWVLLALVLCPIIVVMMALAALTCEACGAPFGFFRRRNKTIDLCLRCAVLHDIRRAKDEREENSDGPSKLSVASGDNDAQADSPEAGSRADRGYKVRSPVDLGVATGAGNH